MREKRIQTKDFFLGNLGSPEVTEEILNACPEDFLTYSEATTGGEDFSYYQETVPGFYFFLGGMTPGSTESFPHHTPDFKIDDSGLLLGVKTLTEMSLDYLNN